MIMNERVKKAAERRLKREADITRVAELLRDGRHTNKEVAEIMGIPESSVLALLK